MRHGRYAIFQMAEVAIPRGKFVTILTMSGTAASLFKLDTSDGIAVSGRDGDYAPLGETAAQQAPDKRFSPLSGIPARSNLEDHVEIERPLDHTSQMESVVSNNE